MIPSCQSMFVLNHTHSTSYLGAFYALLPLLPRLYFYGGFDRHFGIFPGCGTGIPFDQENNDQPSSDDC